jgi:hypothetical protein
MKRLVLFSALALAAFTAACSGGVGGPPAPPPTGNFSAASLKGSYAFQMSGTDVNGSPISRVGSFTADGTGNITAGIEDVNDGGTVNFTGPSAPVVFDPAPQSNYTVLSNGRGTLTLHDSSGALTFSITLSSTSAGLMSAGLMVETDGNATASGSFRAQTVTTTFSPAYAFDFSGVDAGGAGLSFVGQFNTNMTTGVTGGVFDINDAGALNPQVSISPSTITLDPLHFAASGRGTVVIDALLSYVFYVVDGSNLAVVEIDSSGVTSGFATAQNAVPTQVGGIAGSFVFDIGGSASSSTFTGPLARAGRFDANGGAISNLFLDENFSTAASTFGGAGTGAISNVTFTIDPAGSGRGTLGFTDVASGNVFSYVFYLTSATGGFIQDTSSGGVVGDGSLFLQSGTFTAASLAGNFIANWSGVNAKNGFEEDFNSQFALSSATSNNITGVVDYTELGNTSNQVVTGAGVAGTLALNGNGTLGGSMANTVSLQAGGQTFNFHAYLINNNTILLIGTDSNHVVLGSASRQP